MEEVIKHKFSFWFKRLIFGVNKEFSRITWWTRKHTFYDFVIIIIIVGIMALIFFGIDTAYLKA
jgi:preprotein translocase SecE subunit